MSLARYYNRLLPIIDRKNVPRAHGSRSAGFDNALAMNLSPFADEPKVHFVLDGE